MAAGKTRWTYSFSNLGPKKQIAGTTFYKVSLGSDVKWLSMEGIRMLEKARQADVKFKTVRKAVSHFTAAGTKRRLKTIRGNIRRDLEELLSAGLDGFETTGKQKGLRTMLERAGLGRLSDEFAGLLAIMDEAQLREFYQKNKLLLQKFFSDSDTYTRANSTDEAISQANINVRRNGEKLKEKMLQILTRDMTYDEINNLARRTDIVVDKSVIALLMKYKRGHL